VEKWEPARAARAAADGLAPVWPDPRLAQGEREARRGARYVLLLADGKGRAYTFEAGSEGAWRRYLPGRSYAAKVQGDEVVELAPGGP
jgi:hypothetical protein